MRLRMKAIGFLRTVFYARVNHVGFGKRNTLLRDNCHLRQRARVGAVPCACATDAHLSTFFFFRCGGSTEAVAPRGARTRRPNPRTVQTKLAPGKVGLGLVFTVQTVSPGVTVRQRLSCDPRTSRCCPPDYESAAIRAKHHKQITREFTGEINLGGILYFISTRRGFCAVREVE